MILHLGLCDIICKLYTFNGLNLLKKYCKYKNGAIEIQWLDYILYSCRRRIVQSGPGEWNRDLIYRRVSPKIVSRDNLEK